MTATALRDRRNFAIQLVDQDNNATVETYTTFTGFLARWRSLRGTTRVVDKSLEGLGKIL